MTSGEGPLVSGPQFIHLKDETFRLDCGRKLGHGQVTEMGEAGLGTDP